MESLDNNEELDINKRKYCIMADVTLVNRETGELDLSLHFYSSEIFGDRITMEDITKAKVLSSGQLSLEQIDAFTAKQKDLGFLEEAIKGKIPDGYDTFKIEPYVLVIEKNEALPLIINSSEVQKYAEKLSEIRQENRSGYFPEHKIYLSRETNRIKYDKYGNLVNRVIDFICKYRFGVAETEDEQKFFDSVIRYDSHLAEKVKNPDNFMTATSDMEALKEDIFVYYPRLREIFIKLNELEGKANKWRLRRTYKGQQAYYDIKTQCYVLINGHTTETIKQLEYYPIEYLDDITLMWKISSQFDQMLDKVCHKEYSSDQENQHGEESVEPIDSENVYQYLPYGESPHEKHVLPRFDLVSIDGRTLPALFGSDQNVVKMDFLDNKTKEEEPQVVEEAPPAQPIGTIKVNYIDSSLPDFVQEVMMKQEREKQAINDGIGVFRDTPLVIAAMTTEENKPKEKYSELKMETSRDENLGCLQRVLNSVDGFGICNLNGEDANENYLSILNILKYVGESCTEEQLRVFRTISSENPTSFDYRDRFLIGTASQYIKLRTMFTIAKQEQRLENPVVYIQEHRDKEKIQEGITRLLKEYNPPAANRVKAEEV